MPEHSLRLSPCSLPLQTFLIPRSFCKVRVTQEDARSICDGMGQSRWVEFFLFYLSLSLSLPPSLSPRELRHHWPRDSGSGRPNITGESGNLDSKRPLGMVFCRYVEILFDVSFCLVRGLGVHFKIWPEASLAAGDHLNEVLAEAPHVPTSFQTGAAQLQRTSYSCCRLSTQPSPPT